MRAILRACLLGCSGLAAAQEPVSTINLHYQERPPYSSRQGDGAVTGLVANPAAAALAAAGVPFRWVLTPSQRQLALVQSGAGLHCGLGWFRNDERAARGLFSAPLYRDRPFAALVREGAALGAGTRAADLLADARLRLLVKDGYSYGPVLDRLIAAAGNAPLRTAADPLQMAQMLRSGRADWIVVAPEEAGVLGGAGLRLVLLTDVPEGATRHLYCSADVGGERMQRIDRALATLPR
jgi:polar amino acid transport system substrate-binding protein